VVVAAIVAVARRYAFPIDTLLDAGLDPERVEADAKSLRKRMSPAALRANRANR
jgi:hypothetical protein